MLSRFRALPRRSQSLVIAGGLFLFNTVLSVLAAGLGAGTFGAGALLGNALVGLLVGGIWWATPHFEGFVRTVPSWSVRVLLRAVVFTGLLAGVILAGSADELGAQLRNWPAWGAASVLGGIAIAVLVTQRDRTGT